MFSSHTREEEGEDGAGEDGAEEGLRVVAWQPSKDMRRSLAQHAKRMGTKSLSAKSKP